ncbi:MAG: MerR family transcriptional regulator [Chloroflexi bacterium]|nr:MerR family transcriptional regulator [Chloroflexota bacterium]
MSSRLLIHEAADLLGLTPKALRHYEKIGLISPNRSENGYRFYTADHILRLLRIRRLQSLGLSLAQIKQVLEEKDDTEVWQTILQLLLDQVEAQIDVLQQRRDELIDLLADGSIGILAVTEKELPSDLQPAQEYLDRHLIGSQASLWAREKQLDALLASAAQDAYLAVLTQRLMEPPLAIGTRQVASAPHSYPCLQATRSWSSLARKEDQP